MRGRRDGRGLVAAAGGTAGPGRSSRRRAEQHQPRIPHWCEGRRRVRRARASLQTRGQAAVTVSGGRAWPGNTRTPRPIGGHREACGAWPGFNTTHPATHEQRSAAGVEGAGGTCRGAGGRRRGLAGLRDDAPSEARGADGSRAGRRPPAHTAARPFKAGHTAPGTPVGPQATPEIRRVRKRHRHNGRKEIPTAPGTP